MSQSSLKTAALGLAFFGLFLGHQASAAAPQYFQTTQIVGSDLTEPTGFGFAPDGRIFILERPGAVRIYKNGTLLATPFVTLPSSQTGDLGLIGVTFDPNFNVNHFVYFYYTSVDGHNYLVRFDATGDIAAGGPIIIYQTPELSLLLHVGGTLAFGPDGKLYLAIGDNGYSPNSQNLSVPYGKVLRINSDGSVPTDNPFYNTPGALPEIYALGLRNPFRFQFDSATGFLYVGDVGQETWEEVNRIVPGGNYGWPNAEGMCNNCGYVNPIYAYPHNGTSHAVAGGPVYRGSMFPAAYYGSLFFGDYAAGFIKRLTLDAAGNSTGVFDFDLSAGSVVDMKVALDGSLYYITYYPGRLYRISYSQTNQAPVASAGADVTKGLNPLTVSFSSAGTLDPDGNPLTYLWNFGDGTTSTNPNPTKVYNIQGIYVVELSVSDGVNTAQAVPIVIQVGTPPTVLIAAPTNGSLYSAGDTISYAATGLDGAGFDLPGTAYTTEVLLHHGTHIHPFVGPIQSQSGQFTIPISGEPSADTWYEVKVIGTDTNGLTDTKSVLMYPKKVDLTFVTQPAGLTVTIDGQPVVTPQTITGVVGFNREIKAPLQSLNGQVYQFNSWSDAGASQHIITTPDVSTTYTANFIPVNAAIGEYFTNKTLTGGPTLSRQDPAIDFDWGNGSPDPVIPVDNFSARWTVTKPFVAGQYTFTATADDGIRIYFDNILILDKWFDQGATTYTVNQTVADGSHTVKVEYYENGGGAVAKVDYVMTGPIVTPPPTTGYAATFWNTPGAGAAPAIPVTTPTLTRNDVTINFDWGSGSPDPLIAVDHFVARWTGDFDFAAGSWRFTTNSDDGVRVYVDGNLVINNWTDHGATTNTADVSLTAGTHNVKIEYYENGGGAIMQFSYVLTGPIVTPPPPPPPSTTDYVGQYFANKTLTGSPVLTRNDATINFNWGSGSPDPLVPVNNFSARWVKTQDFTEGMWRFTATADDGIRVYFDNVLILDKWIDQGPTTYTVDQPVTAGSHTVKVEYYENGGGAVAQFSYALTGPIVTPPPPSTTDYVGQYFANKTLTGTPVLTRNDATINFNWGSGSPDPLVPVDNFSVRWVKTQDFTEGMWRFTATADDGIRVYFDNVLILDKWIDQGPTTYNVDQAVTAGSHTVKVEYYENGGGAVAQVSYVLAGPIVTPPPPPPPSTIDYVGQYFTNKTLTGSPVLTRNDAAINFVWNNGSPDPLVPVDNFSVRWTRTQTYSAGSHTFITKSDDGVRLLIDGNLVINNWTDHAMTTNSAAVTLTAGSHTVVMEYYENNGGAVAILQEN